MTMLRVAALAVPVLLLHGRGGRVRVCIPRLNACVSPAEATASLAACLSVYNGTTCMGHHVAITIGSTGRPSSSRGLGSMAGVADAAGLLEAPWRQCMGAENPGGPLRH